MQRGAGCWFGSLEARFDKQGQENGGSKIGDGEDEECKGAYPGRFLPCSVDFFWRHVWVLLEVWLNIDLANVSGDVEQERKPANPGKELHLADLADLGWQTTDRCVQRHEESGNTGFLQRRIAFKSRVSLTDSGTRNSNGDGQCERGQDAKHLELSVAKEGQVSRKIDISREVADNVANARQSRSPCVGIVLLMGRGIVDYKGSNTCLDYRKGLVLDVDA